MARKTMAPPEEVDMDLTPMIDVVFQLIIFFVLVTEMAQAELEVLTLPTASEAVPDKAVEKGRLILNVTVNGDIKFRGQTLNQQSLYKRLKLEAALKKDKDNPQLSGRAVLIRGDINAEYKKIQVIMQECAKVGIWKLELAAQAPSGGGK
jgi:biopolymer transport protein ExbD